MIDIFLYGGKGVSNASNSFMTAIKINYYIAAGTAWFVCVMNIFLLYLWDKKVEKKKKKLLKNNETETNNEPHQTNLSSHSINITK